MATDFAGKTALITGAGRGIGRAVALGLGDAGARVVLLARTVAQLDETRALLREQGVPAGRVRVVPADLADEEQRGQAAARVLTAGRVDILVNNAATVEPLGPTATIAAAPRPGCLLPPRAAPDRSRAGREAAPTGRRPARPAGCASSACRACWTPPG